MKLLPLNHLQASDFESRKDNKGIEGGVENLKPLDKLSHGKDPQKSLYIRECRAFIDCILLKPIFIVQAVYIVNISVSLG